MSMSRLAVLVVSVSVVMTGCSSMPFVNRDKKPDAGPKKSEQAYYADAQKNLQRNEFSDASAALEALDTYYPVGPYTEQAQLDLMYSNMRKSDFAGAASVADRFIRLHPTNDQLDYAYYLRGVANMETGYDGLLRYTNLNQAHRDTSFMRLAYDNSNDFLKRFPNSRFTPDVTQRLRFIVNQFAESEMNVARFSLQRKAWVAAVQRARWVIEYYPQTPQIPEALATAAYAYQQMGSPELAAPYIELLRLNYPELLNGKQVRVNAARLEGSWLNRLTLGIAGRRASNSLPPAPQSNTAVVNQSISGVANVEQTDAPTQGQAQQQANQSNASAKIRLGLPNEAEVNAVTDAQPALQAPASLDSSNDQTAP